MRHRDNKPAMVELLGLLDRFAAHATLCSPLKKRKEAYAKALEALTADKPHDTHVAALRLTADERAELKEQVTRVDLYKRTPTAAQFVLLRTDMALRDWTDGRHSISVSELRNRYFKEELTVEHVLPQNPAPDSEWARLFTEEDRKELTNTLGNLTILSKKRNSKLGNLPFKKKFAEYFSDASDGGGAARMPFFEVSKVGLVDAGAVFDKTQLQRRHDTLLNKLSGDWGWRLR